MKSFKLWIVLAVLITGGCLLVYVVAQQNLRQSANDPQIQMAEDNAMLMSQGGDTSSAVESAKVGFNDLAPALTIYNEQGKVLATSVEPLQTLPTLPDGVLRDAKESGESRFTWQPNPNVRLATVITYYSGDQASGFVMATRSLKEVEARESQLGQMVALAWFAGLIVAAGALYVFSRGNAKRARDLNEII